MGRDQDIVLVVNNWDGFAETLARTAVPVAQWIARWTSTCEHVSTVGSNPEAVGSSPTGDVLFCGR